MLNSINYNYINNKRSSYSFKSQPQVAKDNYNTDFFNKKNKVTSSIIGVGVGMAGVFTTEVLNNLNTFYKNFKNPQKETKFLTKTRKVGYALTGLAALTSGLSLYNHRKQLIKEHKYNKQTCLEDVTPPFKLLAFMAGFSLVGMFIRTQK